MQGAGDLVVAGTQCRGRLDGVSQFCGHGLGCRGGQLFGQLGDPACSGLRRQRSASAVAASFSSATAVRCSASRSATAASSARWVTSLSCKSVACVDISVSSTGRQAATRRCVSQSAPALTRAASASSSSARAAVASIATSSASAGRARNSASRERSCSTSSSPHSPTRVAVSWSRLLCSSRRR